MQAQEIIKSKAYNLSNGQHKVECPFCQNDRKKHKHDKPLSIKKEGQKIVYHCHHCNEKGIYDESFRRGMTVVNNEKQPQQPDAAKNNIHQCINFTEQTEGASYEWIKARGLDVEVAKNCGVRFGEYKNRPVIGFDFNNEEGLEAVKYRSANGSKSFWWDGNAKKLWGNNEIVENLDTLENTIIITEGELDTVAIKTAFKDYANVEVYSVPNGSPSKITDNKVDPSEDGRFKYVWEEREKFKDKQKIILATDTDHAGDVLAHELSRRLNKARCYRVNYLDCKDANELLQKHGIESTIKQVLDAEPVEIHGLNSVDHYAMDVQSLYDKGLPSGVSTGYESLDKIYTVSTGMLNIVTGYPGDGKSAFIDQLIVNLGKQHGWKTCFCSFEKPPQLHVVQLSQVLVGKPFFEGFNARMTQEEKDYAEGWIKEHILFQDYQDGGLPTIEAILEKGASAVMRSGIRVLVIDPYNFIHNDSKNGLETDMVSEMLTKVQLFAKQHDVLVIFVAHPTKPFQRDGKKNVCTGVDVAKSMAWFSKADMGLTVYRGDSGVEIHNWKCRWGWQGSLGNVKMSFNPVNGRYKELEEVEDNFDWNF